MTRETEVWYERQCARDLAWRSGLKISRYESPLTDEERAAIARLPLPAPTWLDRCSERHPVAVFAVLYALLPVWLPLLYAVTIAGHLYRLTYAAFCALSGRLSKD